MADEDYIDAAKLAMTLSAEDAVTKARASILEKLQQSITAPPATLSMDKLYEALRSLALNGYIGRPSIPIPIPGGGFHASHTVFNPQPVHDAFGTDLRTVDRMANPHKPGTPEHSAWMMHWADVQFEQQTPAYRQRCAQVHADIEAMEDACAPVVNWVDEILFEVAEARAECENVSVRTTTIERPTSFPKPSITRSNSMVLFNGYGIDEVIADEWTEIEFDKIESSDDQQVWRATWHLWPPKNIGITDISGC